MKNNKSFEKARILENMDSAEVLKKNQEKLHKKRLIIGECSQAGKPISAPIIDDNEPCVNGDLRWYEAETSFILMQLRKNRWEAVGVVPPFLNKST